MARYFIAVKYKGTRYAGFQAQQNVQTIQAELEKALSLLCREQIVITGSSRTDAGVHAICNVAHFDAEGSLHPDFIYKINAILPQDIAVTAIYPVPAAAHARFDALSRSYEYVIYTTKDPFLKEFGYFYPYRLNRDAMQEAATILQAYTDFTSFSKRNTQVKTFNCRIFSSCWHFEEEQLRYQVSANRFLRGMVRGLTGTLLQVGRDKLTIAGFRGVIEGKDCTRANFAVPPGGLFLQSVNYPAELLSNILPQRHEGTK